ncbi:MAG: hypothetical protein ACRCTE_01530 [Cellulosilyticaceae bacterium]
MIKNKMLIIVGILGIILVYAYHFLKPGIEIGREFLPRVKTTDQNQMIYRKGDSEIQVDTQSMGEKEIRFTNIEGTTRCYQIAYDQEQMIEPNHYNIKLTSPDGCYDLAGVYDVEENRYVGEGDINTSLIFDILKIAIGKAETIRGDMRLLIVGLLILLEGCMPYRWPGLFRDEPKVVTARCIIIGVILLLVALFL